ncbi:TPA: hypothetical protein EYG96_01990 [Candidatus Gracilibacteria bacterium]|nr:hypothetical protein [Candidatus Gracilibacteria bacterium]HIQ57103.1 hypothetical protein [Candidatus Gracilibacteria bacterium]
MSLGRKNSDINTWCLENNLLALGWGENVDFTEYKKITKRKEFYSKV